MEIFSTSNLKLYSDSTIFITLVLYKLLIIPVFSEINTIKNLELIVSGMSVTMVIIRRVLVFFYFPIHAL